MLQSPSQSRPRVYDGRARPNGRGFGMHRTATDLMRDPRDQSSPGSYGVPYNNGRPEKPWDQRGSIAFGAAPPGAAYTS